MHASPFDPEMVFVWATTELRAKAKAAPYFHTMGVDGTELSARPTGLSSPSRYRDENVMVNTYEQDNLLRQDFPSMIRWLVKPKSKTTTSTTKIVQGRDADGKIKLSFA